MGERERMNQGNDITLVIAVAEEGRTAEVDVLRDLGIFGGEFSDDDMAFAVDADGAQRTER